jgi:hypothetical protein
VSLTMPHSLEVDSKGGTASRSDAATLPLDLVLKGCLEGPG